MSKYATIYGYIGLASRITHRNFEVVNAHNLQQLQDLPDTDVFPYLSRDMFGLSEGRLVSTFFSILHFGASIKNLDHEDIPEFLPKFEGFLKRLVWIEAKMHLDIEIDGLYVYSWSALQHAIEVSRSSLTETSPVTEWDFKANENDAYFKIFSA
ncbi:MAG TPA: hypothetical protein V6C89_21000 [Drouetiella sp.]|jgi:hypothetical protein